MPNDNWSPNPRQQSLLDEVRARGAVSVERLAQRLDVTMQTVRRDVQRLADAGLLARFHGGVSLPREPQKVAAWKERQALRAEEQRRLDEWFDAQRSVSHVEDDSVAIVLDVDNGPDSFSQEGNGALYTMAGLDAVRRAGSISRTW